MLDNASNMIHTTTAEAPAAATSSKARQITEILTSETTQLTRAATKATAILALPPARQTATSTLSPAPTPTPTPTPPPTHAARFALATRTFLKSLTTKETTLTASSLSSSTLLAATTTNVKAASAAGTSASTTAALKAKEILTNLTPAYLLTTLAAAIATHVKHSNISSNSSNSINNNSSTYSKWTNNKNIQATNKNVSCHMIEQSDKNVFYHMLSLNHQNCTNVLQHQLQRQHHQQQQEQQQQQNRPQRQCSNKHLQQQKVKQFLLLLTCFVAIITIFSLPHLSIAAAVTPTTSHVSTTYETPTTTTTTITKTIKSLTIANATTHEELMLFPSSTPNPSSIDSSTDNVSKDDDNSYSNSNRNKFADNSDNVHDDLTSYSPLATAIENSLRDIRPSSSSSSSSRQGPLENHIVTRLIRSLDVGVNSGGVAGGVGGASSISSIFSPSPVGSSGLTNIFNQNLDTGLSNNIECPSFDESSACPCYKFEDGKYWSDSVMGIFFKYYKGKG